MTQKQSTYFNTYRKSRTFAAIAISRRRKLNIQKRQVFHDIQLKHFEGE